MRPVLDSGYVATPPPPPPPPPPPHIVKSGETVQSVAKHYNVTPQSLASTNHIPVDAPLHAGQVLDVPSPEYYTAAAPVADKQPTQTPQQKTDTAAKAYQQAIKDRDTALRNAPHNMGIRSEILQEENAKVSKARSDFDAAVQAEVNNDVTQAKANALKQYQSIPPQIRHAEQMSAPTVDTNKVVQQATADIQARLGNEPAAKAEVQNAAHAYQVKTTADSLIPYYADSVSAADKLKGIDLKGQPQEVIDAVLADPRVQQWIKQAAADVGKPYDGMKSDKIPFAQDQATQAAANLAQATQGMSPEFATALTQASMPTIQDIAKLQLGYAGSMVPFNTVQSVLASLGSGSQAQAVIQQVASAYADNPGAVGFLTRGGANSELASNLVNSPGYGPAGNPAFAIALGDELQDRGQTTNAKAAFDAAAQGVHDYLANNGGSPLKVYESAHKAAQEKDSHLAELLDKAGPLTTQQQQDFIKAYRADPENAKVYKADAEAAKNLAAWMNANKSGLLFAAGRNSGAAQQLYGMMKDLTTSGQGVTALQFMADIKNDPAASKAFSKFSDYQTKFRGDALVAAQGQLLLSANGDPKSAASQLLELAEPVFKGTEGWNLVKENYQRLANGETTAFNAAQFAEGYKEMGAVGKSWAIASIMTSTFNGANAEQINAMIGAFATAGGNVDGLGTGAVQALADTGKLGRYTESAEAFAKFSSKFIPGLAVVVSTAAFASDFSKAADGNPAYAIALAGDVFSVVGSVIETIPGGQVPGAIVNGIGVVLSAPFELIGSIIDGNKERKEFQEEQVKYLEAAGIGKDEAELLAKDGDSANLLAKQLDLTPEQTQELLEDHPEVFDEGEGTQYAQAVADLVKASGVKPGDVDGFLTALATDSNQRFGDPAAYVRNFYNVYVQHRNNGAQDRFTYGDSLVQQVLQGGYDSAKAYLQQHSPDIAGPDGDARRQADSQFQEAMSAGIYSPTAIVNLINDNKSPAYQAQIVKDLQQNGMLDGWVRDMATSYGGINNGLAAAKSSIQAAQGAGVLSSSQAQGYLSELG